MPEEEIPGQIEVKKAWFIYLSGKNKETKLNSGVIGKIFEDTTPQKAYSSALDYMRNRHPDSDWWVDSMNRV